MSNPFLTLPPQIGRHYRFKLIETGELYECVITDEEERSDGTIIYNSESLTPGQPHWVYWPDGEAKRSSMSPVAILIEDILILGKLPESEEFKELREGHDAMMERLTKLSGERP